MDFFDPKHRRELSAGHRLALVGVELATSVVVGLVGGRWLDERLASRPWLTFLGLVLGLAAGFRTLLRVARQERIRLRRESERERSRNEPSDRNPPSPPTNTPR